MILPASFEYEITKTHDTGVTELRCNATSIDEINTWVDEFGKLNNTHWNFRSSVPNGTRIVCSKKFVCHHSAFQKPSRDDNKKGLSKNADCPATIKATVKIDTISTRKKDPFIKVELN